MYLITDFYTTWDFFNTLFTKSSTDSTSNTIQNKCIMNLKDLTKILVRLDCIYQKNVGRVDTFKMLRLLPQELGVSHSLRFLLWPLLECVSFLKQALSIPD